MSCSDEVQNEIMCGLEALESFALNAILPGDGEYVKISCLRRQTIEEDRSGSVARE
jgi:hypothetical protein